MLKSSEIVGNEFFFVSQRSEEDWTRLSSLGKLGKVIGRRFVKRVLILRTKNGCQSAIIEKIIYAQFSAAFVKDLALNQFVFRMEFNT